MILECLPIISITNEYELLKPISSEASILIVTILSVSSCVISTIRPLAIYFLRTIKNVGAFIGFSFAISVKCILEKLVEEEIKSL